MGGVDKVLLEEMVREDHVEVMTENFDDIDMLFDDETGQAFNNIFASGGDEDLFDQEDTLHY